MENVYKTTTTINGSVIIELDNPRPVKPLAPHVIVDDTSNTVTGIDDTMEYNLDSEGYVAYNPEMFNTINFNGDHTLIVRIMANGINPSGAETKLTLTTN